MASEVSPVVAAAPTAPTPETASAKDVGENQPVAAPVAAEEIPSKVDSTTEEAKEDKKDEKTKTLEHQRQDTKPDSTTSSNDEDDDDDEDDEESSGSESDSSGSCTSSDSEEADEAKTGTQNARDSLPDSTAKLSISDEGIEPVRMETKSSTSSSTKPETAETSAKDKSETVGLSAGPEGVQVAGTEAEPRVKLAVSLENVSDEQQEVLRDPSKRITSDNKQRELDLVAQYEKLNVSARNSSSSVEEEQALKSIG